MKPTKEQVVEALTVRANAIAAGAGRRALGVISGLELSSLDHERGEQANALWRYLVKRGADK